MDASDEAFFLIFFRRFSDIFPLLQRCFQLNVTKSLQAPKPALRVIDDTLDCTYQSVPFERRYARVSRLRPLNQMHPAVVEALVVYDQTAGLIAQQLHHVVRRVYEYEHVAAVQLPAHMAVHYTAQHIEALSHVRWLRVQPELRSVSNAEHRLQAFQDCIYHCRGQSALNAHVGASGCPEFDAHPVLSGGVRPGLDF